MTHKLYHAIPGAGPVVPRPTYRDERKELRARLLARDPHCQRCRKELQGVFSRLPNYANVRGGAIWCRKCLEDLAGVNRRKRIQKRVDEQAVADALPIGPVKPRGNVNTVRRRLLAINPHCCNCGRHLQSADATKPDYACVFRAEPVICCRECLQGVTDFWTAEFDPTCRLDTSPPGVGDVLLRIFS